MRPAISAFYGSDTDCFSGDHRHCRPESIRYPDQEETSEAKGKNMANNDGTIDPKKGGGARIKKQGTSERYIAGRTFRSDLPRYLMSWSRREKRKCA